MISCSLPDLRVKSAPLTASPEATKGGGKREEEARHTSRGGEELQSAETPGNYELSSVSQERVRFSSYEPLQPCELPAPSRLPHGGERGPVRSRAEAGASS